MYLYLKFPEMKIDFFKYQGAGNDFVLIDNRDQKYSQLNNKQIKLACDRRFGIGSDGLMLLQNHPEFDFEMVYFNADGNLGSMCGNGGRCIVAFAKQLNIIDKETNFLAVDGPHYAKISEEGRSVTLKMIDVFRFEYTDDIILNTGSPHFIRSISDLKNIDVFTLGRNIRYNDRFREEGINVNFSEWLNHTLHVRTYERGVEDETLACGTGVTAAAMAHSIKQNLEGLLNIPIQTLGGKLNVQFVREGNAFKEVYLSGPAELVFAGSINL